MRCVRVIVLALVALPLLAQAASGTWSKKSAGGVVSVGHQVLVSRALVAPVPLPGSASATRITWHIRLLNPPPVGLEIKLCTPARCVPLKALSGELQCTLPLSPAGPFRFIYSVAHHGQLIPALNVVSNQLTVTYRD
ncbi:flagellar protein FlhE [[Erwinia] mediterraneensis]|uniref:flagellar protein FlhE n=1 Tax=[Erwinia] mediterraneensis TaxID=2161819 RepID=UPI0010321370|nr:flagellar protein FlhE [[Erwinia] mediterraneensis]